MAVKGPCTSERELGVAECCVLGISHRPQLKIIMWIPAIIMPRLVANVIRVL